MTLLDEIDKQVLAAVREKSETHIGMYLSSRSAKRLLRLIDALPPLAAQWVPVADLPVKLEGEFLYVLLPDRTVAQAMYTEFATDEINGMAWGEYTEIDCIEPLTVQPTHFYSPPLAPAQ